MAAPRKYAVELQERANRMTLDARKDPASRPGACARIGDQLGMRRRVVGWQLSPSLRTDLALDALNMGFVDPSARRPRHQSPGG